LDLLYDDTSASPATLLAPYGDNGSNRWSSSDRDSSLGLSYTTAEDPKIKFFIPLLERASNTLSVPLTFISIVSSGFVIESWTLIFPAIWMQVSIILS
jgi:hypothetical protein